MAVAPKRQASSPCASRCRWGFGCQVGAGARPLGSLGKQPPVPKGQTEACLSGATRQAG